MNRLILLILLFFSTVHSQSNDVPQIKDVSAMCTVNGITASIYFDRPFSGLIYSLGYERVHECLYYNSVLTESVLFSIPVVGCGTRKEHNTHEMLETLENRVYVQMDKYAQTISDKQFAFVCQQPYVPTLTNEIRRHPSSLGKPITPVVGNRYQANNNWGNPIQPQYYMHGIDQNYPEPKTPNFHLFSTPSPSFSNSIVDSINSPFAKKATTHTFGNRNSWSVFGPNQANHFDDFMPTQTTEASVLDGNDADLLQTRPVILSTTTTKPSTQTFSSIIAPKPANSIDMPYLKPETRLFATQQFEKMSDSVILEIQRGQGPFNRSIDSAVKIGDLISLTVHGKAATKDESQFNMFVHSCYASDENNTLKINLIDSDGCAIHSQVLQPMQRLRKNDEIFYYFPLKAFKFPGPTEVFFYCSVDISPEYNFVQQPCNKTTRRLRSIENLPEQWVELNLSKNLTIQLPTSNDYQRIEGSPDEESITSSTLIGGLLAFLALTVASTALAMFGMFKFRKHT